MMTTIILMWLQQRPPQLKTRNQTMAPIWNLWTKKQWAFSMHLIMIKILFWVPLPLLQWKKAVQETMQHRTKANILVTTFGRDTIDNEGNYFINIVLEVFRKHFLYWTEDLLYYMIGTVKEPARKLCCWLLELDHSNIKRHHSKEHSQQIETLKTYFYFYVREASLCAATNRDETPCSFFRYLPFCKSLRSQYWHKWKQTW